jgi:cytochrome c oxidase subunit 3
MLKKYSINTITPFHLVDQSPWPIITAFAAYFLTSSLVAKMHYYNANFFLKLAIFLLIYCLYNWWHDVLREAEIEGHHTAEVQKGIWLGFQLFICSEVMFFFSFFWSVFHNSANPDPNVGSVWPPLNLDLVDPYSLPLLNTAILITSGFTVTVADYYLIRGKTKITADALLLTILLGTIFTCYQFLEYTVIPFGISDSAFSSSFYIATGFHGVHVIVGFILITVSYNRLLKQNLTTRHHISHELAVLYWHFVDVVWIVLYITIYWWNY